MIYLLIKNLNLNNVLKIVNKINSTIDKIFNNYKENLNFLNIIKKKFLKKKSF